jgi:ABC-type nitrate/sulfonate/bicarbonate transport system permease component
MYRLGRLIAIAVFLGLWELISRVLGDRAVLFPPPETCAIALVRWILHDHFARDLGASYGRFLAGLGLGATLAILIGLITGRNRFASQALSPLLNSLRALPPIALLPLVTLLVGVSDGARISVIAFGTFFPVWVSTHTGATHVPDRLIWAAQTLTKSRRRILIEVILPSCMVHILSGIRVAIGVGFTLVFVGELLGATSGLGFKIGIWQLAYRTDSMLAALFVLGASAAFTDWLIRVVFARTMPWIVLVTTAEEPNHG